jgi:hypothetical protein
VHDDALAANTSFWRWLAPFEVFITEWREKQ